MGFQCVKKEGKTIVYSLTEKGENALKMAIKRVPIKNLCRLLFHN